MKELDFPFDAQFITTKHKSLKKRLLSFFQEQAQEQKENFTEKKIAILGGYTTHNIKIILELFLLNNGIRPTFYECEYNQYYNEGMFPNPALKDFAPDVIYLCTSTRNITQFPKISDTRKDVEGIFEREKQKYFALWQNLKKEYSCVILQNNFEPPLYRLLGNKDATDFTGGVNFISRLNLCFADYAQNNDNFYIVDVNYLAADFGLRKWQDFDAWYMYKYALSLEAIPYLCFNVAAVLKSVFGKNKKGLVLDLDDTLWGGVIGDCGTEGIEIGKETQQAEAFHAFQEYLKRQKEIGVVLAIDSKNDEENAKKGLMHPEGVLRQEDFAVMKANWGEKSKNFFEIAKELNLLPESLVFVDDNPRERQNIELQFPNVKAPPLREIGQYITLLDRSLFFETTTLSKEDLQRTKMYEQNVKRQQESMKFKDYGSYLLSLQMRAQIRPFCDVYLPRIAQLTNKTNQFNLTTKRYSLQDIQDIAKDARYITLFGKLKDKFGDDGVVSVLTAKIENDICKIDLFLLSCRVFKKGMEEAMIDVLFKTAKQKGVKMVQGFYFPTAKNSIVKDLYGNFGFEKTSEDERGNSIWSCKINDYESQNKYIFLEEGL